MRGFKDFAESNSSWLYKYRIGLAGLICRNEQIVHTAEKCKNVSLLGYVPELSDIYRASKAVISPTDGTGLKIKVVEALLHGKPVFGLAHTRNGLPSGYGDCVFTINRAEIECILDIPENRRKAETAAFRYIRTIDRVNERDSFLAYLTAIEADRSPVGLEGTGPPGVASFPNRRRPSLIPNCFGIHIAGLCALPFF